MSTTYQSARKSIFSLIDTKWQAKAPAIVGGAAPEIRYQGAEKAEKPAASAYWMRAGTQTATTRQTAYIDPEAPGQSPPEFTTDGVVILQLFAPMTGPGSYAKGELLAEAAQCMFMATQTSEGVWFRNPRINELENDGTWYRWNIIADFQFNQVRG